MQEFIFTSSILILAVALLRLILGRHISARVRYALWLVVLLRLVMPLSPIQSSASAANLLQMAGPAPAAPAAPAFPAAGAVQAGVENAQGGIVPAAPQTPAAPGAPARPRLPENALYLVWGFGTLAAGGWMLAENIRFAKKLKAGRTPLSGAGLLAGQDAGGALSCPLPLWRCEGLISPCLFGALRPAIYLNEAACENAGAQGWAVRHELQHYRHGDQLWCLARCACLAVYWWHPLVWLAAALSRRDCELACDEGVTAALSSGERLDYGRCLLALAPARGTARPGPLAATGMSENARQLKSRLSAIATAHKPAVWAAVAALAAALVLSVTTLTSAAEGPALTRDARAALDMLQGSITVRDGILGFTLPQTGFAPEEWSIHISGSAQMDDGQMSLHFLEEESWQGGRWYPITGEAELYSGIQEIWMDASLPGETGNVSIRVDLRECSEELASRRAARLAAALPQGEEVWLDFPLGDDTLVYSYLTAEGMPNDEDTVHGHVYLVRGSGGVEQLDPLADAGGRLTDELGEGAGYFAWYPVWVNEGQRVLFGWQVPAGSGMSTRLWTIENGTAKELDCPAEQLVWLEGNEFTGTRSAWDAIQDEDGSTGHTQKIYWLYWNEESGALREYGGVEITEAGFLEMARKGSSGENEQLVHKILDSIRAEGGVISSIWLRGNGVVNINYRIPLDESGTAWANHNISLASDAQRNLGMIGFNDMSPGGLNSELLALSDQGGVYEAAGWPEIAVYPTVLGQ